MGRETVVSAPDTWRTLLDTAVTGVWVKRGLGPGGRSRFLPPRPSQGLTPLP